MKKIIILLVFFLNGCDYYDHRLEIINKSENEIVVENYLDTVPNFPSLGKTEFYLDHRIIQGDSAKLTAIGKKGWPFNIIKSKNKKLNLVVYNIDSLRKYQSIDTLIRRQIYTRYEFSEDEMKDKDWKVVIN